MDYDAESVASENAPLIDGVGHRSRANSLKGGLKSRASFLVVPALFVVQLAFSCSALLMHRMVHEVVMDAVVFTFLRCLCAALVVFAVAASSSGISFPSAGDVGVFVLIGVCGMYLGQLFLLLSLQHISVLNATVIGSLQPVATMLVGHTVGMEQIEMRSRSGQLKLAGVLIAVVGGTTIVSSQASGDMSAPGDVVLGNILALSFCFGSGAHPLLQRWLIEQRRLNTLSITAWSQLSGALVIGLTLPVSHFEPASWDFTWHALATLGFVTLIASALSYALMAWAVKHSSPIFVMGFTPLQLVLTASISAIFMGEAILFAEVIGIIFVCVGLWVLAASRGMPARVAPDDDEV
jgi:drug/metabolite transporter (DMT)-like permease